MSQLTQHVYTGNTPQGPLIDKGVRSFWEKHPECSGWGMGYMDEQALEIEQISGLIINMDSDRLHQLLREAPFPVVNISNRSARIGIPCVLNDDERIGRMAANYLMQKGYRKLWCIHMPGYRFSEERILGFCSVPRPSDCSVEVVRFPGVVQAANNKEFAEQIAVIVEEILRLDKGETAVFIPSDVAAAAFWGPAFRQYGKGLFRMGWMAVDAVSGPYSLVPGMTLTSVQPDFRRLGYEAAALLKKFQSGEPQPDAALRIAPIGIVEGSSTPGTAKGDWILSRALQIIDQAIGNGQEIRVADLADKLDIHRRTLLRKFREQRGHSVTKEIQNRRLELATQEMLNSTQSLAHIAQSYGYSNQSDFSRQFRRTHGVPPHAWRKMQQSRSIS